MMSGAQVDTHGLRGSELPLHFQCNGPGMLTWEPAVLRRGIHQGDITESGFSAVGPNTLQALKHN